MLDKTNLADLGNRIMRKLFGLEPGWWRNIDIVKNNYALAKHYMAAGNYKDAVFRLKFLVWLDPAHKGAWLELARAQFELGDRAAAAKALKKLFALDANDSEGKKLKQALDSGHMASTALDIAPEMDAALFYAIHKACFPIYWKEQEIADMLLASGTQGWLARLGDKPAGMLLTRAQFEQAEILTIAVLPEAQRAGIAKRLMADAEQALSASGVKKIFLEVAENNVSAHALYLKLGYAEVSRRAGYYRQENGSFVDALVMAKEIG